MSDNKANYDHQPVNQTDRDASNNNIPDNMYSSGERISIPKGLNMSPAMSSNRGSNIQIAS